MASTEQIVIRQLPTGALAPTDFEVRFGELPELGEDEVLVRVVAITIGAGQRAGLQGSASYAGPSVSGVVMTGTGVGVVEQSTAAGISVGDLVVGPTGWTRHAVLRARETRIVSPTADPGDHLGVYGTNGLTAYFGLFDIGRPVPGDTVLVSAAAGSVGHLVGQMAKHHGCRVVGVAGSESKCTMLVDELGFDAAVNRSADDFRDRFRAATPDRINVYFDNTGGDILGSALFRMATHGRIVCCGAVSAYDTSNPGPSPRGIPGLLVNNRVRMEGFIVFDYADRYDDGRAQMAEWMTAGQLQPRTTSFHGLDAAPHAFVELLGGRTIGTTVVYLE